MFLTVQMVVKMMVGCNRMQKHQTSLNVTFTEADSEVQKKIANIIADELILFTSAVDSI